MNCFLLGIKGRANSGKSTTANAIVHRARHKELIAESYELSKYILEEAYFQGRIPTGRPRSKLTNDDIAVLSDIGETLRMSDPLYWVRKAEAEIREDRPEVAIIPNIRRLYEADWVRRNGGLIISVKSLNPNGTEFISLSRDPNSALETEQAEIIADYHLVTPKGQPALLKEMAITLFDYIWALQAEEKELAA